MGLIEDRLDSFWLYETRYSRILIQVVGDGLTVLELATVRVVFKQRKFYERHLQIKK
jgi:hypothetical protein